MSRWLAAYAGAVLVIVWAVLTAWHYLRRPPVVESVTMADAVDAEWDTYQRALLR